MKKEVNKKNVTNNKVVNAKTKGVSTKSKLTKANATNAKQKVISTKNSLISKNDEVTKLIQIVGVIVLIFLLFFLITSIVTKKPNDLSKNNSKKAEIQFEEVLAGNILSQKENEYYVLVVFEKDRYLEMYKGYYSQYKAIPTALAKYDVNINNVFNSKYISEESNYVEDNLKFSDSTLLKIKNQKVVASYEGHDKIIEHFKEIVIYEEKN